MIAVTLQNTTWLVFYFFPLSQNALTSWMIAVTLQKWLKASFILPVATKCCGILNNSCYVTWKLKASSTFPVDAKWRDLLSKKTVWFWTQGAFFIQICLVLKQNDTNRVKKVRLEFKTKKTRKKVRLEFGTRKFHVNHWFKESAPVIRTSRRWVFNFRWRIFLTRLTSLRSKL